MIMNVKTGRRLVAVLALLLLAACGSAPHGAPVAPVTPTADARTVGGMETLWANAVKAGGDQDLCTGWILSEPKVQRAIRKGFIAKDDGYIPDAETVADYLDAKCLEVAR